MWEIKGKDNQTKATVYTLEYNGEWMGESYVTVSIESPAPVNFEIGDYIIYRDERFEINYDPGKIKSAPRYEKGDAFKYENIKFNSLADELIRCDFLDVVLEDNQLHFTGLPKFSFYGGVRDLANRMQANLDRTYGKGAWTVVVSPEYSGKKEVNISVDAIKVQGALSILVNDLETYYTIKGRTITIGTAGVPAGHLFKYGKGNGLYGLEENAETDQAIVTRLRAYGSTRNLPHRYYNSLTGADGKKLIPDNMAVQYLMLPEFPYSTQDPYIDSANKAKLGIREGAVFFDGSGELEEIYPSIEGMTAEYLHKAGVSCNSTGALDEIISVEQITDNGVGEVDGNGTKPADGKNTFKVILKDLGFDINDHRTAETATLSFKTGMLGGRDFEIVGCKKVETGGKVTGYELELNRIYDDGIQLWLPYSSYNAKAEDKIVILHIKMPEVYIKAAAQRLKEAAKEWLSKNDYSRSIYAPKIDEIFMARQHDLAMASGGKIKSLHDTLKEGMLLLFEDEDLNIDASIFIDRLTITECDSPTPTYEVVLKEEKTVGRLDKMQNQIDSLAAGKGQGGGGYTAAQIRSMIDAYGGTRFLSKIKDDRTAHKVSSDKAFEVGKYLAGVSGGIMGMDANGDSFAEVARLYVRVKAFFEELTVIKSGVLAGKQYITPGGGIKCTGVEEVTDASGAATGWRCYFLSGQDGEKTECRFIVGDQAISEMFNAGTGTANKVSNHRYWRLVTAVNNDAYADDSGNHYGYIELSKSVCETGSDTPKAGDEICQLGYQGIGNPERQTAMVFSTVDADAPSVKLFGCINSFSLGGKAVVSFGRDPLSGLIYFRLGGSNAKQYLEYTQDGGLVVAGSISTKSTLSDGRELGAAIDGSVKNLDVLYVRHTSQTQAPALPALGADGTITDYKGWQTTAPPYEQGKFIWQTTYTVKGDGTAGFVGTSCLPGQDVVTQTGEVVEYAAGTSGTVPPATGWQSTIPAVPQGQFQWTRVTTSYSDGPDTVSYSVAYIPKDASGYTENLLTGTIEPKTLDGYVGVGFPIMKTLEAGKKYTLSFTVSDKDGYIKLAAYISEKKFSVPRQFIYASDVYSEGRYVRTFTAGSSAPGYHALSIYNEVNDVTGTRKCTISEVKLEEGVNDNPVWSPHPSEQVGTPGATGAPGTNYTPNLLKGSNVLKASTKYEIGHYEWDERPPLGTVCTLTVCAKVGSKDAQIRFFQDNGYEHVATFDSTTEAVKTFMFAIKDATSSGAVHDRGITFFRSSNDGDWDADTYVKWATVTLGDTPQTAWIASASEQLGVTIASQSVKYAKSTTATQPADTAFTADSIGALGTLAQGTYIWSLRKLIYTDGTETKEYAASRIGADGDTSVAGLHLAYASDITGTLPHPTAVSGFSTTLFAGAKYIGIYKDDQVSDSTNFADYDWAKWAGDDAAPAKLVVVNADATAFTYKDNFATLTGVEQITFTAALQGTTGYQWSYKAKGMSAFKNFNRGGNGTAASIVVTPDDTTLFPDGADSLTVRCSSGGVHDEVTIYKVSSGSRGADGAGYTENLLIGSGFHTLAHWGGETAYRSIDNTHTLEGRNSVKINSTAEHTADAWYGVAQTYRGDIKPGDVFTASVWVYCEDLSTLYRTPRMEIWALDNNGRLTSRVVDLLLTKAGEWQQFRVSHTMPAGTTGVQVYPWLVRTGTMWLSSIKLERGNNPKPVWTPAPADGDAYTVILGNEAHLFEGDTEAATGGYTDCSVTVYKGGTRVAATIGSVTDGLVQGITVSNITNPTATADGNIRVNIAAGTKQRQGVVIIPVTVDGNVIKKKFSWALSLQGTGYTENLLINSRIDNPTLAGSWTAGQTCSIERVAATICPYALKVVTRPLAGSDGADRVYATPYKNYKWKVGATYTYSFMARTDTAGVSLKMNRAGGADYGQTHAITSEWKMYHGTIKASTDAVGSLTFSYNKANATFYITMVKLEEGENDSPVWSPNPAEQVAPKIKEQYAMHDSDSVAPTTGWSYTKQPWVAGKFYWTRTEVTYGDGTVEYTTPVCATGAPAFRLDLSDENVPVSCYADGTVAASGTIATSMATVYKGGVADTGWTFTKVDSGCTSSINSSTGAITISSITADKATVTVTARKSGQADQTAVINLWKVKPGAGYTENMLLNSGVPVTSATYPTKAYNLAEAPAHGEECTVTLWGELSPDGSSDYRFAAYNSGGNIELCRLAKVADGVYSAKFRWVNHYSSPDESGAVKNPTSLHIYPMPNKGLSNTIRRIKLERGYNDTPVWTPNAADLAAKSVVVNADAQVFSYENSYATIVGASTINLSATLQGTTGYQWSYRRGDSNASAAFTNISGATSATYALAHNASIWGTAKSITLRCTSGGMHDEVTIAKVSSGAKGDAGEGAYTVLLTNESHTFAGGVSSAIAGDTTCEVLAYKGATKIPATIDSITGQVAGLTTEIANSSGTSTNSRFTVRAATTLIARQGVLKINLTIDGKSFVKEFSWSLALKGDPATVYQLGLSANAIVRNLTGGLSPSTITVTKYKITGDSRAITTEKCVHYQALDGTGKVQTSGTLATPGSSSATVSAANLASIIRPDTVSVVLTLRDSTATDSTYQHSETVPVIDETPVVGGGNVLLNSGFRGKNHWYWGWSNNAVIDTTPAMLQDGQNPVKLSVSGLSDNKFYGIQQNGTTTGNEALLVNGRRVLTASIWVYCTDRASLDQGAKLEVFFQDASGVRISGSKAVSIVPTANDTWQRFSVVVPISVAATTPYAAVFSAHVVRNGTIWLACPQLEWGSVLTEWAPSSLDNDYLTKALRDALAEQSITEGGLILATLLRLGFTKDGAYRVMSGLSGIANDEGDPAIWMGGEMIDKIKHPEADNAAKGMFYHSGEGYLSNGLIRFFADVIKLGGGLQIDSSGLKLLDSGGGARLSISNGTLPAQTVDAITNEIKSFSLNTTKTVRIGYRNQFTNPNGLTTPGRTGVMEAVTWNMPLGTLTANSRVSGTLNITLGTFNPLSVPSTRPFGASFMVELYYMSGSTKVSVSKQTGVFASQNTANGTATINTTVPASAAYYIDVTINASSEILGNSSSYQVTPTFPVKVSMGAENGITIASDGLMAVLSNLKLLATNNYFGVLIGNYGLRVTASGISKRNGTTTWNNL